MVLEPTDHSGVARKLQLDTKSAAVVELELGRYQLTTTAPLAINHRAYGWNIELALFDHANFVRLSQENAVRLEIGDIIEPASIKLTTAKALTPKGEGSVPVHARSQIIALLDRWASSIRARDLRMQMSCYAPELVRYLQQQNVSWAEVKRRKQRQLQLYSRVRQIALSDINLSIGEGHAFGTALTKWTFTDADVESRGTALVNFEFAQIGSRWLITSEWQQVVSPQASRKAVQASSLQTP